MCGVRSAPPASHHETTRGAARIRSFAHRRRDDGVRAGRAATAADTTAGDIRDQPGRLLGVPGNRLRVQLRPRVCVHVGCRRGQVGRFAGRHRAAADARLSCLSFRVLSPAEGPRGTCRDDEAQRIELAVESPDAVVDLHAARACLMPSSRARGNPVSLFPLERRVDERRRVPAFAGTSVEHGSCKLATTS
jgi:hypothetical protein